MARPCDTTQSSHQEILSVFSDLKAAYACCQWMPSGNTSRDDLLNKRSVVHRQCAEFMASLVFLHLYDAWGYLENAMRCLMRNDQGACGHFSYYAELRAAMSFLAVNGVLTVNGRNYILTQGGNVKRMQGRVPTHRAVWNYLKDVVKTASLDKLTLGELICPCGVPLSDWLRYFSKSTTNFRSIFSKQMCGWGKDLKRYKQDRELRNRYSYTPQLLMPKVGLSVRESFDIVDEFWGFFGPDVGGAFKEIDRYILWRSLQDIKQGLALSEADYQHRVSSMLSDVGVSAIERKSLWNDLTGTGASKPMLFGRCDALNCTTGAYAHIGMFVRAFFLLRIATSACRKCFLLSSIGLPEFHPWIAASFSDRGWYENGKIPSPLLDLYADVEDALDRMRADLQSDKETFTRTHAHDLNVLSRVQYIMLWGLDLR